MNEVRLKMSLPPRNVRIIPLGETLPPLNPEPSRLAKPLSGSGESQKTDSINRELIRQATADREFIESTLKHVARGLEELRVGQQRQLSELQQAAVELAVLIGGRLLYREVNEDRFAIEEMVRDMASQLIDDEPVAVRLHPKDLQLMQQRLGDRPLFPEGQTAPKLIPDGAVDRGSCIVEGKLNSLVNDPASELIKLRDELLERMTHARS